MAGAHQLTTWQWIPCPREEVFAFFADARNLERMTPAFLRFRVLTPEPIAMGAGTLIDYRLRLHGAPLRWRTEITAWEPPRHFIDVQRRGPYAEWVHTHTFDEQEGGTFVRDAVRYRLRGPGPLARTVNRLLVAHDLRRIFEFRHTVLGEIFAAAGPSRFGAVVVR